MDEGRQEGKQNNTQQDRQPHTYNQTNRVSNNAFCHAELCVTPHVLC